MRSYRLAKILPKDQARAEAFLDATEEDVLTGVVPVWVLQMKQRVVLLQLFANYKVFVTKSKAIGTDALLTSLGVSADSDSVPPVQSGVLQQVLSDIIKLDKKSTAEIASECVSCTEAAVRHGVADPVKTSLNPQPMCLCRSMPNKRISSSPLSW